MRPESEVRLIPFSPPISWEEFIITHPPYSVALDGYVSGPSRFDPSGPRLNLNHHEEANPLSTNATCAQALHFVKSGLPDRFRENGRYHVRLFLNDVDQDSGLASIILLHPEIANNHHLERLTFVEGLLDATAGGALFDLETLEENAWIFEPVTRFQKSGQRNRMDSSDFAKVLEALYVRIAKSLAGEGGRVNLDLRFRELNREYATGREWAMVEETGEHGRIGVFQSGINAFVAMQQIGLHIWRYSLIRRSEIFSFAIDEIVRECNMLEAHLRSKGQQEITTMTERQIASILKGDIWGGGLNAAGSPRVNGSMISPEKMIEVVNTVQARQFGLAS